MRNGMMCIAVAVLALGCVSAFGLTGSGDSAIARLDTVSPTLQSVSAATDRSLDVTFSEPMRTPGVMSLGNYSVSGLGAGTLSGPPSAVIGSGPYALLWSMGEMRNGATVTVTATGLQDLLGNLIDPAHTSASTTGLGIPPVFSNLAANPAQAASGDTVTIMFSASEALGAQPTVTVNGHDAAYVSGNASGYIYGYAVQASDPLGMAEVSVVGSDLAGNTGAFTDNTTLDIVKPTPPLPLRAWPLMAVLLAATAVVLLRRPGIIPGLLCVLLLMAPVAFADSPAVSNVTFTQGPNGTIGTKVDIYYDLVAPNGPCDIAVSLSKDGGTDGFVFPVTTVTGDVTGVATGTGKHIVWSVAADYPNEDIALGQIRVTADDGSHTLTYTAGANGTISGTSPQTVNYGASGTAVTAVANGGYRFVQWSDASTINPRADTSVMANLSVTATFASNQCTLTYTAGANGSITGTSPQTVAYGASGTAVTAVANTGYHFVQWSDTSTDNPRTDTNVTADISVAAIFVNAAPVVTSFAINSGAATTMPLAVTLNNTATNSPTQYMASESSSFTGATWQTYGTAPAFTLSFGVGTRTVYFKAQNPKGVSATVSDTIFITPNTVSVASGTFSMGRTSAGDDAAYGHSAELPVHSVTLGAYQVGKYHVTNKEYCDVLNWAQAQGYLKTSAGAAWANTGSIYTGGNLQIVLNFADTYCNIQYSGGVFTSKTRVGLPGTTNYSMDTHPVEDVSWYGSVAFCNWLSSWQGLTPCYDMTTANWPLTVAPPTSGGYRLPTEAEWERAAAWDGSKHWIYGFTSDTNSGPGSNNRCNDYWYNGSVYAYDNPLGLTGYPYTSPIGWFNGVNVSPNGTVTTVNSVSPVGCYDMSGNVSEWCGDWYAAYDSGPDTNPTGPATGSSRVGRGGSWSYYFNYSRSASRYNCGPAGPGNIIGFRLARS